MIWLRQSRFQRVVLNQVFKWFVTARPNETETLIICNQHYQYDTKSSSQLSNFFEHCFPLNITKTASKANLLQSVMASVFVGRHIEDCLLPHGPDPRERLLNGQLFTGRTGYLGHLLSVGVESQLDDPLECELIGVKRLLELIWWWVAKEKV